MRREAPPVCRPSCYRPTMTRYQSVFFDVGDTLVYPHPSSAEVIAGICREAGYSVTREQVEEAEAAVAPALAERQRSGGELYSISAENSRRFWSWIYSQLLAHLDAPASIRQPLAERFHAAFNSVHTWRLYQDAVPTLTALQPLRAAGVTLAIISNWEDWLDTLLTHLDIDRYFDFAVISAIEQLEKPDLEIFRSALSRAGVAPREAVHIGDSVHADVEGAHNAGMTAVLLDRRGRYMNGTASDSCLPTGTSVIRSLEELPALLI